MCLWNGLSTGAKTFRLPLFRRCLPLLACLYMDFRIAASRDGIRKCAIASGRVWSGRTRTCSPLSRPIPPWRRKESGRGSCASCLQHPAQSRRCGVFSEKERNLGAASISGGGRGLDPDGGIRGPRRRRRARGFARRPQVRGLGPHRDGGRGSPAHVRGAGRRTGNV